MTSVFVVKANDSLNCVFSERWKAEIYCQMQKEWQKERIQPWGVGATIYYRYEEVMMDRPGTLFSRPTNLGQREMPTKLQQEGFREALRARWAERQSSKSSSA
jgi:hypothetical protein